MRKTYFSIAAMVLFFGGTNAQNTLNLTSGKFEMPRMELGDFNAESIANWPEFNEKKYGIIEVATYPSIEQQERMKEVGITFLSFLPESFYLVEFSSNANLNALDAFGVISATAYENDFKTNIDFASAPSRAVIDQQHVKVNVHPFSTVDLAELVTSLSNENEVLDVRETYHFVTVKTSEIGFQELINHAALQAIDWAYDYGAPENYTGRTSHRSNVISSDNNNGLTFDGSGIGVMLQDDGAIGPHIDHEGRIGAQFWLGNDGDHGDHVGGTISGAGNIDPRHAGQAKAADLYVYKAAPQYQGYDSIANHYSSLGVVITSTSYSNGCNAGYTALARAMDEQVFNLPALMHVFSAGNSGTSDCGYGAGNVWGNITGGHKVGKNVIAVANLTLYDNVANSSSRGPAHDGRIKPDISAKGTDVISTLENNEYGPKTGTSMSCPGVSGTLAQLYDAYESLNGSLPDGGLMKAIVLNTADDLGNTGPDFIHGWGRINARKAYELIELNSIMDDSVAQGDVNTHLITVPVGALKGKLMVYWTDPEAAVNANTALINDIDILAVSPTGDTIRPWELDPTPNPATLGNPAIQGEDHLNNVEQIEFESPESGVYTVVVTGGSIPMGPQSYYLVYWFEQEDFVLTYPIGGESFEPFSSEVIRWDVNNDSVNVALEYSTDDGMTWNNINASVNPSNGYFAWTVPNVTSGECKIRVTQGALVVESGKFSIMPTTENLIVEWACPDSIGLSWDGSNSATSYDIYKLGVKYMDSIGTSNTESFVDYFSNPMSDKLWYSVSADGPNNAKSKRQIAIQKSPGVFNCYLPVDLGVESIFPMASTLYPCFDGQSVGFVAKNYGDSPILVFDASYKLNGAQQGAESFTVNIAPGGLDTLFFSVLPSFISGMNSVEVSLSFMGDLNAFNDTIFANYWVTEEQSVQPILRESFDQATICSDNADCGETSCPLENGWTNEENGTFDDVDWRVFAGPTFSSGTGPSGDNTTGSGRYIYIESSGTCEFQQANLISPCIDLSISSAAKLTYYYHMLGTDMGELHVDVYDGSIWHLDVAPVQSGNRGNIWYFVEVDLSAFSGGFVNIRFRGITGSGSMSDMALDDISIVHLPVANFDYFTQPDGQTVLFNDLSVYADSMIFDLGDNSILQDSVPTAHIYNQQITYTVTQIVWNEIGSDTMSKDIMNLGLADKMNSRISVYPNPAQDVINISEAAANDEFEVHSGDGRLVLSFSGTGSANLSVDISGLSDGLYFLSIKGNEGEKHPIIIAR